MYVRMRVRTHAIKRKRRNKEHAHSTSLASDEPDFLSVGALLNDK